MDDLTEILKGLSPDQLAELTATSIQSLRMHQDLRKAERLARDLRRENEALKQRLKLAQHELEVYEDQRGIVDALKEDPAGGYDYVEHKSTGTASAILVMTDWHVEETVDPKTVNGLNEYNLDIAARRVEAVCNSFLKLLKSSRVVSNIEDMVLLLLGDFINGYLHDEAIKENSLSPTEAIMFARRHIRATIDFLLENTDLNRITISTSRGNHGRSTKKLEFSTGHKNSYEQLMYWVLAEDYKDNERVRFVVSDAMITYLNVQGKVIRHLHGELIRFQGGVGGLTIPASKAVDAWDDSVKADVTFFGHHHQFMRHRKFVACNALIGYNAFCEVIKARYSPPSQTYAVVDSSRPGLVDVREVYCD